MASASSALRSSLATAWRSADRAPGTSAALVTFGKLSTVTTRPRRTGAIRSMQSFKAVLSPARAALIAFRVSFVATLPRRASIAGVV